MKALDSLIEYPEVLQQIAKNMLQNATWGVETPEHISISRMGSLHQDPNNYPR